MSRRIDRTGWCYGRWAILREAPSSTGCTRIYWCRCSCGRKQKVAYSNLQAGKTTGCLKCHNQAIRDSNVGKVVHGNQQIVKQEVKRVLMRCLSCKNLRWMRRAAAYHRRQYGCRRCSKSVTPDTSDKMLVSNGEKHNVSGWAKKIGITREALRLRLLQMSLKKALTTPRAKA